MPIKLYHISATEDPYGGSRNAAKAAIALREANVKFEEIQMNRETDLRPLDSTYRKNINPNGVTPTLDDDGFLIWESAAVLSYIAEKWAPGQLLSKNLQSSAVSRQWLAWEGATFQPGLMGVFVLTMDGDTSSTTYQDACGVYNRNLQVLEQQLTDRDYLAGEFSIADIALGCAVPISFHLNIDLKPYPNICTWLKRLHERPSFAAEACAASDIGAGPANGLI